MECIQNEKSLNTRINKLNWRFNYYIIYMLSDHKSGLLLFDNGLCKPANLAKCLHGKTQNSNEGYK